MSTKTKERPTKTVKEFQDAQTRTEEPGLLSHSEKAQPKEAAHAPRLPQTHSVNGLQEASRFLEEIGVELNDEQRRKVNLALRLKQARAGNVYLRTELAYDDKNHKLPNQAQQLLAGLSTDEGRTTAEWLKYLDGVLITNQPPERVLNFYKRRLEDLGLITRQ